MSLHSAIFYCWATFTSAHYQVLVFKIVFGKFDYFLSRTILLTNLFFKQIFRSAVNVIQQIKKVSPVIGANYNGAVRFFL